MLRVKPNWVCSNLGWAIILSWNLIILLNSIIDFFILNKFIRSLIHQNMLINLKINLIDFYYLYILSCPWYHTPRLLHSICIFDMPYNQHLLIYDLGFSSPSLVHKFVNRFIIRLNIVIGTYLLISLLSHIVQCT